jgi:LPXTG-site transpeptidase (sortase) family protein
MSMMVVGLGLLAGLWWQLWGTGIQTSHAQAAFRHQVVVHGFPARPISGGVVGFIRVPKIGLDMAFVQGVSTAALKKGPGHYPGTPLPGQGGNVAIAGHRTTYLHPFWALDQLRKGDAIVLQTRDGTFTYHVLWRRALAPDDWSVVAPTATSALTLTTCNPLFHSTERLVVRAVLVQARRSGTRWSR